MERILTYAEALREATELEMTRDSSVIVFGLGVDDFKGTWGTTAGLQKKFGRGRVFDTPLAEDGMTGVAVGAALAGLKPVHVHIRMDFLLLAMNQLVNIAAKSRYMYGGAVNVPITVRAVIGRSWGQGAQHSQALQSFFMHTPGLKVVAPSTPYDAKGMLIASIRDPNPVIFVEHRMLHLMKGHVPEKSYTVPFGQARILRKGKDITLVGISHMVAECLRAAHHLEKVGVDAEVIDPVSLSPLDMAAINKSINKTGRVLVVDSAWLTCGAGAEILARVFENFQGGRAKKIRASRMGYAPVVCPPSKPLEDLFYPNPETIAKKSYELVRGGKKWTPKEKLSGEIAEFRGPF